MLRTISAIAIVLLFASCGRPNGAADTQTSEACALIAHPEALFAADAQIAAGHDVGSASCRWISADGKRGGELIIFSGAKLGAATAQAFLAETTERWGKAQPDFPLEPVSGVGDEAQMANHLPGYQTQIVFRKGERVVTVQAWSGDAALSGEQLARRLAQAADAALK
ncbi:MAG: hypothetical protein ABUS48_02730 [Pseudomonadota bacterium]